MIYCNINNVLISWYKITSWKHETKELQNDTKQLQNVKYLCCVSIFITGCICVWSRFWWIWTREKRLYTNSIVNSTPQQKLSTLLNLPYNSLLSVSFRSVPINSSTDGFPALLLSLLTELYCIELCRQPSWDDQI